MVVVSFGLMMADLGEIPESPADLAGLSVWNRLSPTDQREKGSAPLPNEVTHGNDNPPPP